MANWATYPVTHGYITSYEGPGSDTPHYAEDIGTPFHTPLTAILPGTVKQADYAGWGGEIFIQPDDKSYPEYYFYHPDRLEVSKGQHVTAGQEIALSGGENPGYPGAEHPALPEWSSGLHTHVGWFQKWQVTPIGTRPYGPDPTDLVNMAKGNGGTLTPPGAVNPLDSTSSGSSGGNSTPIVGGLIDWMNANAGPFMMRVGVGIGGLALAWIGMREIANGLQGGVSASGPAPAKQEPEEKTAAEQVAAEQPREKEKAKREKEEES